MGPRGALAAVRRQTDRRPVWWQEVLLIAVCFLLYSLVTDVSPLRIGVADRIGRGLLRAEEDLHIDSEHALNDQLAASHLASVVVNYYYLATHFLVVAGVLVWLFRRRASRYRDTRRVLLVAVVISVVCFWLVPATPPRILPGGGFIDTLAKYHAFGGYQSGPTSRADQYAALPSDHVTFAVWVAWAIITNGRARGGGRGALRWVWVLYPVATTYAILATATHYLLDAAAGVATFAVALVLVGAAARRRERSGLPEPIPEVVPTDPLIDAALPRVGAVRKAARVLRPSRSPSVSAPSPLQARPDDVGNS